MDIGNAVSIRVGTTDARKVSQINPDAVRNGEPGTFADQDDRRLHSHRGGDVITQCHTGIRGDHGRRDRVPLPQHRDQRRQ